ncbi:hypothetical protein DZF84_09070 [Vibrio parahaemolyticus]|uniref:hypothetical protein n=1 Tax=Vibrio parahaemolyticus TaxID=670 RepID=UPI00084A84A9|nr:hypothetical protein [Vibrio parahaemolyticus]EGQ8501445.1 hypothetical protein [Vibrio parahaemolyticus]EGR2251717.1 hypothetical protein [Vibrio parahaemolyticus]EMA2530901.1 hypothetical protein [Vibrio parahaemolyticus]MBE4146108.1 hypothetical protein [Vibrio parahaemolyticus]MBM4955779.1 hypothetical protein [Vibrio parahaemolyticus]
MKISSNRDFRDAMLYVENLMKQGSYVGLVNFAMRLASDNREREDAVDILIGRWIHHRSGLLTFDEKSMMALRSEKLASKLIEFKHKLKIRKQDEAPQVGADSSIELCDGCKNTFKQDHAVCPDCSQLGDV